MSKKEADSSPESAKKGQGTTFDAEEQTELVRSSFHTSEVGSAKKRKASPPSATEENASSSAAITAAAGAADSAPAGSAVVASASATSASTAGMALTDTEPLNLESEADEFKRLQDAKRERSKRARQELRHAICTNGLLYKRNETTEKKLELELFALGTDGLCPDSLEYLEVLRSVVLSRTRHRFGAGAGTDISADTSSSSTGAGRVDVTSASAAGTALNDTKPCPLNLEAESDERRAKRLRIQRAFKKNYAESLRNSIHVIRDESKQRELDRKLLTMVTDGLDPVTRGYFEQIREHVRARHDNEAKLNEGKRPG